MVYQSEKMVLYSVMEVFSGRVNDVVICENVKNGRSTYYTVLVIKQHEIVRKMMNVIELGRTGEDCCIDMFDSGSGFCIVFDYVRERKLSDFYMAGGMSLSECEDICLNLVIQCMTSPLPYALLELIIRQKQIHLMKDNSIVLGYCADLEELDENCDEKKCVMECALIVRDLLEKKVSKKNVGYTLLSKKIPKQSYTSFRELYKDIRLAASSAQKRGLLESIKMFFAKNNTGIFRILLIICIVLVILSLIMLISRMIWGEVPLLRLFSKCFRWIGTESMLQ